MRIRSTKPEFWRSERVAAVRDWEARFVLKALESYVDDNGVGKDSLALIASDTFPHDLALEPSGTLKRVQVAIDTLFQAGFLWRYEHEGTRLLYISWWDSTQYINRPSKGRLPRPDGSTEYGETVIGSPLLSPPEPSSNFSAGTGEQGTGEQVIAATPPAKRTRHTYPDDFEEFWQSFPGDGRKDKPKALTAWKKAVAVAEPADIIAGAKRYATQAKPGYTKYAQGWLSGERWNDIPATATRPRSIDDLMNR